MFKFRAIIKQ